MSTGVILSEEINITMEGGGGGDSNPLCKPYR